MACKMVACKPGNRVPGWLFEPHGSKVAGFGPLDGPGKSEEAEHQQGNDMRAADLRARRQPLGLETRPRLYGGSRESSAMDESLTEQRRE